MNKFKTIGQTACYLCDLWQVAFLCGFLTSKNEEVGLDVFFRAFHPSIKSFIQQIGID